MYYNDWFWKNFCPLFDDYYSLGEDGFIEKATDMFVEDNKKDFDNYLNSYSETINLSVFSGIIRSDFSETMKHDFFIKAMREWYREQELLKPFYMLIPPKNTMVFLDGNDVALLYFYYDPLTKGIVIDDHSNFEMVNYRLFSPSMYRNKKQYPFHYIRPYTDRWFFFLIANGGIKYIPFWYWFVQLKKRPKRIFHMLQQQFLNPIISAWQKLTVSRKIRKTEWWKYV